MVRLQRGQVVRSTAGRDKGKFMVVVQAEGRRVWVCDGKERPLGRPKLKNPIHLAPTNTRLAEEALATDRKLRAALRARETNEGAGDDPGTAVWYGG